MGAVLIGFHLSQNISKLRAQQATSTSSVAWIPMEDGISKSPLLLQGMKFSDEIVPMQFSQVVMLFR
jgi:hypothetical protein